MSEAARGRLLIVDDEIELKNALCESLADAGFEVVGASDGAEGLRILGQCEFDVLLSDLMMPGMDGIAFLRQALEVDPNLVGIIMTGQGTISTAVEAMQVGAFDYLLKPFNMRTMLPILARALDVRRLRTDNARLRRYVEALSYESPRYQLVGSSPAMRKVVQLISKVAPTDATVLIRGPSGSGKELVARALHTNSARRGQPMITVNCAALQESLLESELFGHEKGAFTGASTTKVGLIEVAEGGTLFIDEVAEMSPALQAKLLRVLEDGHYRRVGGVRECHANVRILAATNKRLEEEQRAGRFREDLFYRLNVVAIALPPLRERKADIPELVNHLLANRQIGSSRFAVEADALRALENHTWPGNVRELANVLERAQILAEDNRITLDDLPDIFHSHFPQASEPAPFNLKQAESQTIQSALGQTHGNKLQAAKLLGVSRRALYRLLDKHQLQCDKSESDAPPPTTPS